MDHDQILQVVVQELCQYALEREDVKWIADSVSESSGIGPEKLEYELQILKIVTVGWSISYFLGHDPLKGKVVEPFWTSIHQISTGLSQTTSLFIGKEVDYFRVVKSRLDSYVLAMSRASDDNPALSLGPEFSAHCGCPGDLSVSMAGSRMFMTVLAGVKQYLLAAKFKLS